MSPAARAVYFEWQVSSTQDGNVWTWEASLPAFREQKIVEGGYKNGEDRAEDSGV